MESSPVFSESGMARLKEDRLKGTALKRLPDADWLFGRERPQGDDPDSEPEQIV